MQFNIRLVHLRISIAGAAALLPLTYLAQVSAQPPSFTGLGSSFTPAGVSHDGKHVYGSIDGQIVRWTKDGGFVSTGITALPIGVSGDGSTVVGGVGTAPQQAFRWTEASGLETVGAGHFQAVSYDGSVAVGLGPGGASRWTVSNGFVPIDLSPIPGGDGLANATSSDGSIVVGRIDRVDTYGSWRWTEGSPASELQTPAAYIGSLALRTSYDGDVVAGYLDRGSNSHEAGRWTAATGWVGLGDLAGGTFNSEARSISADGEIVVGMSNDGSGPTGQSNSVFIWDAAHGMRKLANVLSQDFGLSQALDGWRLTTSPVISGDGLTIAGRGVNPSGQSEAWIAYLGTPVPEPTTVLLASLAIVPLAVSRRLRDIGVRPYACLRLP